MWLLALPALALDSGHVGLQRVLDAHLHGGRVDYAALHADPAPLDAYVRSLATVDVDRLAAADRIAFWINAYNALTIDVVADEWPVASIRDLDGGRVWDTRRFPVAGRSVTLNDIEHRVLRPLGDARVHAALNCASVGCPALAPQVYTGTALDAQLDAASRRFVADATLAGGVLTVNRIFDWYGEDWLPAWGTARFDIPGLDGKAEAVANFVAAYAPEKAGAIRAGGYAVRYAEYDWGVNRTP